MRSVEARFVSKYRLFALKVMARLHGGHITIEENVHVLHHTVFQGRGLAKIGTQVSLGFAQAGALKNPILLQPRETQAQIVIGEHSAIMDGCEIIAWSSMGKNCLIGPQTLIFGVDLHGINPLKRNEAGKTKPVIINNNVWVSTRAIILKGVEIGQDAVIAAGFTITKNVERGAIVAANPMQVIGSVYARDS